MYIRLSQSGPRTYVRLVEAYRDDQGRNKQRHLANLGRLEDFDGKAQSLLTSLRKLTGQDPAQPAEPEFNAAKSIGGTWVLNSLWHSLGLNRVVANSLRSSQRRFDAAGAIKAMVFNRLCDPQSKLGVLRWLEEAIVPGLDSDKLSHKHLLHAMDALEASLDKVREALAKQIKPLLDQELTVAFYDLTTIRVHGESELEEEELRRYGRSKELDGGIARQFLLGVVQSSCGIPLDFAVFEGNQAEVKTLLPVLETTFARYQIKRVIVVADRGLLSLDNLAELSALELPGGGRAEFIMAVPAARYAEMSEILTQLEFADDAPSIRESRFEDYRLIIAHDPERAQQANQRRQAQIDALCELGDKLASKLDRQDQGQTERGRRASDRGAYAQFQQKLGEARLKRFIKADLTAQRFSYHIDEAALEKAALFDGKLILVSNVPKKMDGEQIVSRYKSLADIEDGFRVLKHDINIAPVYHRLPERLRAHSAICFLALLLYRVMRQRLRKANNEHSARAAIAQLNRLQQHSVKLGVSRYDGIGKITPIQKSLFDNLEVDRPSGSIV